MEPYQLKCSDLKNSKYRKLCSELSYKVYDKKHYGNIAEFYFPELKKYFYPKSVPVNQDGLTGVKEVDR